MCFKLNQQRNLYIKSYTHWSYIAAKKLFSIDSFVVLCVYCLFPLDILLQYIGVEINNSGNIRFEQCSINSTIFHTTYLRQTQE